MVYILVTICCAFAALGSFLFGYDSGIIVSSIAQHNFVTHLGAGISDAETGGIISSFTGESGILPLFPPPTALSPSVAF